MRNKTLFICQQCDYSSTQWLGKCPNCGMWNSLVETIEQREKGKGLRARGRERKDPSVKPQKLSEIKIRREERTSTGFTELDRVLGGGMLTGSVILLSGDPGIGKSTLLLQVGLNLSQAGCVLYVSGEESATQIKTRALRLRSGLRNSLYISSETLVEEIISQISEIGPIGLIIDSIQTIQSEDLTGVAGSVGQIRECARVLTQIAKKKGITLFLIGHVTKEGAVAGPMVLSHMVDTVLFLEGEEFRSIRVLRTLKNRFGPIDEVGVFEMTGAGIREVKNPSDFFLSGNGVVNKKNLPGSVVVASVQGSRPILVEVQALVVPSKLVVPRRVVSGADFKRVELLCAVLQKICKLPLDRFDIFINVAGGIVVREPGADLGIALAIFSSFRGLALSKTVAIAEVGLLGELRAVAQEEKRENEAKKLGFKNIITAKKFSNLSQVTSFYGKKN